ncbi:cell division cycle protein 20 homolog B [Anarrhichthys ocellatus]|uniref:cell division cycle protein 20 homolog B n=1 Tax=Anarrhichthys ocellatus TaxID=433405 RepID=UPI0012ED86D6|nr:cell division cycle protein 20 homolog B [Anarrhichthys ocellatus]
MRRMLRDVVGKRRHCPFKGQNEAHRVSYKRFKRRIIQRSGSEGPAASTPLATWQQCEPSFELDTVRQRLELDSPPRHREPARRGPHRESENTPRTFTAEGRPATENAPEQGWVWRAAVPEGGGALPADSDERRHALQPFALLDKTSMSQRGKSVMKLAAPSLLNDYCKRLWDVEHKRNMRRLPSHLSVVRGLSWKQQLLSSGSALGRIHHLDPRAPEPLVGAVVQEEEVCGLQWSPGGDWLASGSTEGLLRIWGGDIAGVTWSRQPITTMRQPSSVKAMGWCPWQRKMIATGGGWNDGELRVWDTDSGTCVTSANTHSQICSLRWAEKNKCLVTSHGLPHHQVNCWSWEFPSLSPIYQLSGHSHRVLHLAVNPDGTQIFSAGADQQFHIWDV